MNNMLPYALLACLCLSLGIQAELLEEYRTMNHEFDKEKAYDDYIISPDTFGYRDTFVVAHYKEMPNQRNRKIHVKLALLNDTRYTAPKECSLVLSPKSDTIGWKITSLRRVTEHKVILAWETQASNELYPNTELIVYDMAKCEEIFLNYNLKKIKRSPIILPEGHGQFDVFIDDVYSCEHKFAKCCIHYDLKKKKRQIHPFNVKLDWDSMNVEYFDNGDFLIQGLINSDGTHQVLRMNHTSHNGGADAFKARAFMKLSNGYNHIINVVSSDKSFCYITNPGKDTEVRCLQIDDDENVILNKTVTFEDQMRLIDAKTTRKGELLLISKKANCTGEDTGCKGVYTTRIGKDVKDEEVEHVLLTLPCNEPQKFTIFDVKYDEVGQRVDFHYGCRKGHGFYLSFMHIY